MEVRSLVKENRCSIMIHHGINIVYMEENLGFACVIYNVTPVLASMERVDVTQVCARCRMQEEYYKARIDDLHERQNQVEANIATLNDDVIPAEEQQVSQFMDAIEERTGMVVSDEGHEKLTSRFRLFQEISRQLEKLADYTFAEKEKTARKLKDIVCVHR